VHSSHSLYRVINLGGVTPVFVHAVWKLSTPPRVQFFMWLVSKDKILTKNNLGKRRTVVDPTCLFCYEEEIVNHLLFECVMAKRG
jgi:hypothetical protein